MGFRPEIDPGPPLDRWGSPGTSICTKNQPRRPILRPFRGTRKLPPDCLQVPRKLKIFKWWRIYVLRGVWPLRARSKSQEPMFSLVLHNLGGDDPPPNPRSHNSDIFHTFYLFSASVCSRLIAPRFFNIWFFDRPVKPVQSPFEVPHNFEWVLGRFRAVWMTKNRRFSVQTPAGFENPTIQFPDHHFEWVLDGFRAV